MEMRGRPRVNSQSKNRNVAIPRALLAVIAAIACACLGSTHARADIAPSQTLVLFNSQNAESQAVRDLYVAAHPGVLEFDLNDATLLPGEIDRADYLSKIRDPLRTHLNSTGGTTPLSQQIICIVTTRGLPARIAGGPEFALNSSLASVESELCLLQQDLEVVESGALTRRYRGVVDNPYHLSIAQDIDSFDRSAIETQRSFVEVGGITAWTIPGLTPGDIYLVCRVDAPTVGATTALDNIAALLDRSASLSVKTCEVQALLDEYPQGTGCDQLDDDGGTAQFPALQDYENAAARLSTLGIDTLHDETSAFFRGTELPDQEKPVLVVATYGENHDFGGCGVDPPGPGNYLLFFDNIHPAACFFSIESFNGNSLIDGTSRGGQEQALDFIHEGGSFTIPTVAEPFTPLIADVDYFVANLYQSNMTFAEAAYASMPGLSWQTVPVGDPLAKVTLLGGVTADLNGDDVVGAVDLATLIGLWGSSDCLADLNTDGIVGAGDLAILIGNWD